MLNQNGWLGRLLANLGNGQRVSAKGALAVNRMPLILKGAPTVHSWAPAISNIPASFRQDLSNFYQTTDSELHDLLSRGYTINNMVWDKAPAKLVNQVRGGALKVESAFYGAGRLFADVNGPRIAVLPIENWDTHINQAKGLVGNLSLLDRSLGQFREAIGETHGPTLSLPV